MIKKAMANAKAPRTASPPTTPPTMAPVLLLLPPDAADEVAGGMVCVLVDVDLDDCAPTSGFVVVPVVPDPVGV
jgi:hypothetical protein